jgi:hypothetical protein
MGWLLGLSVGLLNVGNVDLKGEELRTVRLLNRLTRKTSETPLVKTNLQKHLLIQAILPLNLTIPEAT